MNGISSVTSSSYTAFTNATTGASNASSGAMSSSQSGMSSMQTNIDSMLGSIDSGLAGNEVLKMAIAMLILQSMEGGEGEGKSGGKGGDELLKALAGMMGQSSVTTLMMSNCSCSGEQTAPMSQAQNAYSAAPAPSMSGGMVNAMA